MMSYDKLSEAKIKKRLDRNIDIFLYDQLDSTNAEAKRLKNTGEALVIADMQTKGRGRIDRSFYSPKGSGIYMSLLVKPFDDGEKNVLITTAVSVAVCRAIEKVVKAYPGIKWVNDLYLDNKKICGILTEAVTDVKTGKIKNIVIGIGINCRECCFPEEISDVAGSLNMDNKISRNELVSAVVNEIFALDKGFIEEYRKKSMVIGREITILKEKPYYAKALDIDEYGGLVIEKEQGQTEVLRTGEISIRLK